MKAPDVLLDYHGYPTDEWLEFIRNYTPDTMPIMDFIDMLSEGVEFPDFCIVLKRKYRGVRRLEFHTGGWSGNESVIEAILSNIYLTHFPMQYKMWITGGHYYFEIKER